MSPTQKARAAIDAATFPQGWDPLPPVGRWSRCALLLKPVSGGTIGMRAVGSLGSVEVDGTIFRPEIKGQCCARWIGDHTDIQAGIAWVTTALLARA